MPVFKKLGPGDQIDNVLVLEPHWDLASGSSGWRGSPEGSASLNAFGGAHRSTSRVVRRCQGTSNCRTTAPPVRALLGQWMRRTSSPGT